MEFIAGIGAWLATWMFTWPFFLMVFVAAIFADSDEDGFWQGAFLLGSIFVGFHLFDLSWQQFFIALVMYIPLGVAYSAFRWKRHIDKTVAQVEAGTMDRDTAANKIDYASRSNISDIAFWVAVWPVSGMAELCSDLIDLIRNLVSTHLQGIYKRLSQRGIARLDGIAEGDVSGSRAATIIAALGGEDNIRDVDSCITRLRVTVHDTKNVDRGGLKDTGAAGVVLLGDANIQVIYGLSAEIIAKEIKSALK
ncbi:phosphotransferase system EIIB [Vibrio phage 2.275.O._10N.286.54.E11]|nr:phosphotransferase system EIIB [Vibrio phage 2.275.O._10N.286.54.E11]